MESLLHDLRAGARLLIRHPGFVLVTGVTLAISIGLCTSVFSVLYAVLLRPLPYASPDRLVLLTHQAGSGTPGDVSPPDMLDYRSESRVLADLAGMNSFGASLTGDDGDAEQIQLGVVTANFFSVLGVRPRFGRDFEPADDTPMDTRDPRNTSVIILGHGLWERRYGGDPNVIGRTIRVGGTPMVVVGILPKDFRLHMPAGVSMATDLAAWTPLRIPYATSPREGAYLKLVGRLRPGASVTQVQSEVNRIADRLRGQYAFHEASGLRARVAPMHGAVVAHVESTLAALAAAVGFVLLIGCANVANLLLVRLATRDHEILIRTALGASRTRLARQLLSESTALALFGALGGVALGWAGVRLLRELQPAALPHIETVTIDPTVLAFAMGLSLASVLGFGLVPALVASRVDVASGLRERAGTGRVTWRRLRSWLVVAEVALSVVLLVGAGLMIQTARALQGMEMGFESANVATFRVSLPFTRYRRPEDWSRFTQELERQVRAIPGVRTVGATSALPASGVAEMEAFGLEAARETEGWGSRSAAYRTVTPEFFSALSIPLRAGRSLAESDIAGRARAIVVDDALARRLWPNESAVGKRLVVSVSLFDQGYRVERVDAEVVGVVGTAAIGRADATPAGTIYVPHAQQPLWNMAFAVAADRRTDDVMVAVRATMRRLDADLPVYDVRPMDDVVAGTMASTRMVLSSLAAFAAVAATLASVGLYAVVAYIVRQRRRELSIRIALGATPGRVGWGVLREGLTLVAGGVVIGVAAAMAAAGVLSGLIVGVAPRDPGVLATVALLLFAVGTVSGVVPAYRAASTDPVTGLREE